MSLVFVRHGETPLNVSRVLQPPDTPLSDHGLTQARAVARRLAELPIVAILSSDLPRALHTAQAIALATGAPIETTALLHERNFGDLRGSAYDTLGFDPLTMDDAPSRGESAQQFRDRVGQAFAHALARHGALQQLHGTDAHLAVITHGLVIRRIAEAHLRLGDGQVIPERIGNTSVTIVSPEPPHLVELLDCIRHLDDTAPQSPGTLSGG